MSQLIKDDEVFVKLHRDYPTPVRLFSVVHHGYARLLIYYGNEYLSLIGKSEHLCSELRRLADLLEPKTVAQAMGGKDNVS